MFPFPFGFIGSGEVIPDLELISNDYAMEFDAASSQYVNIGSPSELNLTGEISVFAWIKTNSLSGTDGVVMDLSSGGTQAQWGLEINRTAAKVSVLGNGSGAVLTGSTSLTTGTWFHIGFTRSGTASNWTYTIYVNGVSDGTITTTTNPDPQQGAAIGRLGSYNGGYFDGDIDEVAIWNKALELADVQTIYNSTNNNPGKCANLFTGGLGSGLVYWNRMGD